MRILRGRRMGYVDICVSLLYFLYSFMMTIAHSSVLPQLITARPKMSFFTRSFVNSSSTRSEHGEVTPHLTVTRRALLLNAELTDVN